MPLWIDSHCHPAKDVSKGVFESRLAEARTAGIEAMICVGTSVEDWMLYCEMAELRTEIHYTVGLHPCAVDVAGEWEDTVPMLAGFFTPGNPPVALGEIGLDYFHLAGDPVEAAREMLAQEAAFRVQLDIALQLDCPVVVHSRDSFDDCVRMIDESGIRWERVVFHCFTGDVSQLQRLRQRGGRASFTGMITYPRNHGLRAALVAQGPEVLMLETDAPYLAPVPHRGKENHSALIPHIAEVAADCLGLTLEELAEKTTANARSFFGLP